jgi:hypothetical protein
MASRPAASSKPEWHIDVADAAQNQTALSVDSLDSTRPIHSTCPLCRDRTAFDAIA